MHFQFISLSDPRYKDVHMLRWEGVGKSMGLPPAIEQSCDEKNSIHLVALEKNHIIGCVFCTMQSETEGRVWDFVLSEQGKGIGRKMMHKLEERLCQRGISSLHVLARENDQELFAHLGYASNGLPFEEYGVSYQKMCKTLH